MQSSNVKARMAITNGSLRSCPQLRSKWTFALTARALFAGTLNVALSLEQSDEGMPGAAEEVGEPAPDTTVGEEVMLDAVATGQAVDLGL